MSKMDLTASSLASFCVELRNLSTEADHTLSDIIAEGMRQCASLLRRSLSLLDRRLHSCEAMTMSRRNREARGRSPPRPPTLESDPSSGDRVGGGEPGRDPGCDPNWPVARLARQIFSSPHQG